MSATYPEIAIDRERAIETVHGLQVDLSLLAAWLAREPDPALHQSALWALESARFYLERHANCTRRHKNDRSPPSAGFFCMKNL